LGATARRHRYHLTAKNTRLPANSDSHGLGRVMSNKFKSKVTRWNYSAQQ
jgi:hypothetical protein